MPVFLVRCRATHASGLNCSENGCQPPAVAVVPPYIFWARFEFLCKAGCVYFQHKNGQIHIFVLKPEPEILNSQIIRCCRVLYFALASHRVHAVLFSYGYMSTEQMPLLLTGRTAALLTMGRGRTAPGMVYTGTRAIPPHGQGFICSKP